MEGKEGMKDGEEEGKKFGVVREGIKEKRGNRGWERGG